MRALYTLLYTLALPLVLLRLVWRARKQPEYLRHVGERLGCHSLARPARPLIWLHAVSVGETRAAAPLVQALREKYPGHVLLMTHMTPTGRATSEALFGDSVLRCYLPYDLPWAVVAFLKYFQPVLGLVMETEIWPNLAHACRERGVPLYLVNARLSEKSFAGYQRMGGFTRDTLRAFTGIAAQTLQDVGRFEALGAQNVSTMGNLKFDVSAQPESIALGERWKAALNGRRVLLAASTRDGEEALLLDAGVHEIEGALLILVPRHPQRFDEVATLLEKRGVSFQRRGANAPVARTTCVLLGDSMGEMPAYYAACDVAFIGGSLLPFGGQNLIEACTLGKPVLVGEHTYNFAEASATAIKAGAALRVTDAQDLARKALSLLTHEPLAARMSEAALKFAREHTGATQRLLSWLPEPGCRP
jgi:3-deoxy-D-manno-octulosonic-acid transferase